MQNKNRNIKLQDFVPVSLRVSVCVCGWVPGWTPSSNSAAFSLPMGALGSKQYYQAYEPLPSASRPDFPMLTDVDPSSRTLWAVVVCHNGEAPLVVEALVFSDTPAAANAIAVRYWQRFDRGKMVDDINVDGKLTADGDAYSGQACVDDERTVNVSVGSVHSHPRRLGAKTVQMVMEARGIYRGEGEKETGERLREYLVGPPEREEMGRGGEEEVAGRDEIGVGCGSPESGTAAGLSAEKETGTGMAQRGSKPEAERGSKPEAEKVKAKTRAQTGKSAETRGRARIERRAKTARLAERRGANKTGSRAKLGRAAKLGKAGSGAVSKKGSVKERSGEKRGSSSAKNGNRSRNSEEKYVINCLKGVRKHPKLGTQLLCDWVGYPGAETWEPIGSISQDCPDLVQEYLEKA